MEKRMLRRDFITPYSSLKGGCSKVGGNLFSHVTGGRTRENGLKLHQESFRLNNRKIFLLKELSST